MSILAVVGIVGIFIGFLGLFHVIAISLPVSLLAIVIGVLLVVFGGRFNSRSRNL